MSDLLGDLSDAARRLAGGLTTEVSVAALEQKVADAYRGLGRMYFEATRQGMSCEGPAFDRQVARIEELLDQIRQKRYDRG